MKRAVYSVLLIILGLLCLRALPPRTLAAWTAQEPAGPSARPIDAPAVTHIRSTDPAVHELLAEAAASSFTIARLIDFIERSDVIVYLQISRVSSSLPTSHTRLISAGPTGFRYLSVWIDFLLLSRQRVEMLGHELQHVAEITRATDVNTEEDMLRFYQETGYPSWSDHAFETREAILVQLLVSQELRAADEPRTQFDAYCAPCHGRDGRGSGPGAHVMKAPPPDLTLLSRQNSGAFPWSRVERCIMATDRAIPAAVTAGMPVWRPVSSHASNGGPAEHARDIAAYVESLQRRN